MPDISASSACVIDADSGRVLYDYHAHDQRGMASTTKIMTAIVALEHAKPDDIFTVSSNAAGVEGTSMGLRAEEKISLDALLYGLMLASGNDAAVAIAENVGGSVSGFAQMMNEKVKELGLSDTSFQNPNGLTADGHYTTAYDLAQITRYALGNESFRKIVSTQDITVTRAGGEWKQSLHNHNRLLSELDGCSGVKTGYTKAAGRCLVSAVDRDGKRFICVTLRDPDDWNDHRKLMDAASGEYQRVSLAEKGDLVQTIPFTDDGESIGAITGSAFSFLLTPAEAERVTTEVQIIPLDKTVEKGDEIGTLTYYCGSDLLGSIPLHADRSIQVRTPTVWEEWNQLILIFFTKAGE